MVISFPAAFLEDNPRRRIHIGEHVAEFFLTAQFCCFTCYNSAGSTFIHQAHVFPVFPLADLWERRRLLAAQVPFQFTSAFRHIRCDTKLAVSNPLGDQRQARLSPIKIH
ncbi:hypothetical protein D3C74_407750 [compost metagenome]